MKQHIFTVYILASISKTLYIGITNNMHRRLIEHRNELYQTAFTKKYHVFKVVYIETYDDVRIAIAREKQIKKWNRMKKVNLIETTNPNWIDISTQW